jgi:hypothetical protein
LGKDDFELLFGFYMDIELLFTDDNSFSYLLGLSFLFDLKDFVGDD